jgi:hypothetical protein
VGRLAPGGKREGHGRRSEWGGGGGGGEYYFHISQIHSFGWNYDFVPYLGPIK